MSSDTFDAGPALQMTCLADVAGDPANRGDGTGNITAAHCFWQGDRRATASEAQAEGGNGFARLMNESRNRSLGIFRPDHGQFWPSSIACYLGTYRQTAGLAPEGPTRDDEIARTSDGQHVCRSILADFLLELTEGVAALVLEMGTDGPINARRFNLILP